MNELATATEARTIATLMPVTDFAANTDAALRRIQAIRDAIGKTLKPGIHFGEIPGTDKKTSFKAGDDEIANLFDLYCLPTTTRESMPGGHYLWTIESKVIHRSSGQVVGYGVGAASTMESKFRYRGTGLIPTGKPVPKQYWELKTNKDWKAIKSLIGAGCVVTLNEDSGKYEIFKKNNAQRLDNPDIADTYNSCVKAAMRRSNRDGIMRVTGASVFFNQDIGEDAFDDIDSLPGDPPSDAKPAPKPAQTAKPAETPRSGPARPAKAAFDPSKMLAAYQAMGVAPHMLVAKVGRTVPDWTDADQQFARDLYKRLKDGETTVAAEWPPVDPAVAEVCSAIRESAKKLVAADLAVKVQSAFKGAGCECSEADLEKQPKTRLDILARMLSDAVEQIPPPAPEIETADF